MATQTVSADPQITEYMQISESLANEISKFCRTFNQFILDLSGTTEISGAAMLTNPVKLTHKARYQIFTKIKFQDNTKLFDTDYIEGAFDSICAHDKEIGLLVIDQYTLPQAFDALKDYLEYMHPPVMVLGSAAQEKYLKKEYNQRYSFYVKGKGTAEIGKVYYNA